MQGFKSKSLPPCYSYGALVLQLRSTAAFLLEVRSSTEQQCRGTMPGFAGSVAVTLYRHSAGVTEYCWCRRSGSCFRRAALAPGTRASATLLTGKARLLLLAKLKLGKTCKISPLQGSWYWLNRNWAKRAKSPFPGDSFSLGKHK